MIITIATTKHVLQIDRLYDWRRNPNSAVRETLKKQKPNTKEEFDERTKEVTLQFAEQVDHAPHSVINTNRCTFMLGS